MRAFKLDEIEFEFPNRVLIALLEVADSVFHCLLTYTVADPGFSPGGAPTPKNAIIFQFFAENCMKMKEFGPPGGGGARVPGAPLGSANDICK